VRTICSAFILLAVMLLCPARAAIYHVDSGGQYTRVSDVASKLKPGDIVEVSCDSTDSFAIEIDGTWDKPIIIRGRTSTIGSTSRRPSISLSNGGQKPGIALAGNWLVLEGFDISGASLLSKKSSAAVHLAGSNLTVRNCRIHGNGIAIDSSYMDSGDILVEFCEFFANCGRNDSRTVYLNSAKPGAKAVVRFCYFHDTGAGPALKTSFPRNIVMYNWFENLYADAVRAINCEEATTLAPSSSGVCAWYPAHTDILGNVFIQGWSPGRAWAILKLGAEGPETPGTEGDFSIAHNLFIATNNGSEPTVAMCAVGAVDHVRAYNNVFVPYGTRGISVYSRGTTWETPRTKAFMERRGTQDPVVEGANNWLIRNISALPVGFSFDRGVTNPGFVDMLNGDYRPRKDSPLAGAGLWPLPKGRIIDLVPEYEPQRGIPADLKPKPRRKVTPPSIGPFEVPAE
jgi:hypothetical protein